MGNTQGRKSKQDEANLMQDDQNRGQSPLRKGDYQPEDETCTLTFFVNKIEVEEGGPTHFRQTRENKKITMLRFDCAIEGNGEANGDMCLYVQYLNKDGCPLNMVCVNSHTRQAREGKSISAPRIEVRCAETGKYTIKIIKPTFDISTKHGREDSKQRIHAMPNLVKVAEQEMKTVTFHVGGQLCNFGQLKRWAQYGIQGVDIVDGDIEQPQAIPEAVEDEVDVPAVTVEEKSRSCAEKVDDVTSDATSLSGDDVKAMPTRPAFVRMKGVSPIKEHGDLKSDSSDGSAVLPLTQPSDGRVPGLNNHGYSVNYAGTCCPPEVTNNDDQTPNVPEEQQPSVLDRVKFFENAFKDKDECGIESATAHVYNPRKLAADAMENDFMFTLICILPFLVIFVFWFKRYIVTKNIDDIVEDNVNEDENDLNNMV